MKISNFLSTLFGNKDFISQESPILADKLKSNFDQIPTLEKIFFLEIGLVV